MNINTAMNFVIMLVGLILLFFVGRFFYNTFTGKGNFLDSALTGFISKIRGKDASLGTTINEAMNDLFPDSNKIKQGDSALTKKAKSCLLEKNSTAGRTISPWCNNLDVKRKMAELS